jgi:hypothetical protein
VQMTAPPQHGSSFQSAFFRFLEVHDIYEMKLSGKVHLPPTVFTTLPTTALPHLRVLRGMSGVLDAVPLLMLVHRLDLPSSDPDLPR